MSKQRHFYTIITPYTSFTGRVMDISSIDEGTTFKADSSCKQDARGVSVISFYGDPLDTLIKYESLWETNKQNMAVYEIFPIGSALPFKEDSLFKMYAAPSIKIVKYINLETLVERFKMGYRNYFYNIEYLNKMCNKFPESIILQNLCGWAKLQRARRQNQNKFAKNRNQKFGTYR